MGRPGRFQPISHQGPLILLEARLLRCERLESTQADYCQWELGKS
jgi:hypothetical protein